MSVDTHTASLLYRYLRMLSVRVDRGTVARLLAHPLGNSMRGLSDALDGLEVRNAAYQLPPEYFGQLEAPFIAVTRQAEEPFCLVERLHGTMLTVYTRGRRIRVDREAFLRTWTGGVLVGEVTADTRQDRFFHIWNVAYWIRRYSLLAAWMLATVLVVGWASSPMEAFYRSTLCAGVLVASAILYKETADRNFLHRFCHIGKAVDCNAVLQSRGSRLAGVGLGEWSLFYFLTLLLFVLVSPVGGWAVVAVCGVGALAFTFYSLAYQVFVVRKGCMLCLVVDGVIWLGMLPLYRLWQADAGSFPSWGTVVVLGLSAGISWSLWLQVGTWLHAEGLYQRYQVRWAGLLSPQAFRALQALEPVVGNPPPDGLCLCNGVEGTERLLLVTNPTCRNCARVHPQLEVLSASVPVSLLLLTFPYDAMGQRVAQTVIATGRVRGWRQALDVLGAWFRTGQLPPDAVPPVAEDVEQWKRQQLYCVEQGWNRTPWAVVGNRPMPEAYELQDLKYVLT